MVYEAAVLFDAAMTTAKPPRRGVPQPLQGGPQRFGPYSLEARLAVGGTSEVYLARLEGAREERDDVHQAWPERLIVKRLLPHLVRDPEGRTMFEREAVLHAAVIHPNVVSVFASGVTAQGEPYLAMEYVDGCDAFRLLRRATQERVALPLGVSIYIARSVLLGLGAVHDAQDEHGVPFGIIHRDVTPSNLYLSRDADVKLGDFGIARSDARADARADVRSEHGAPALPPTRTGEIRSNDAALLGKFSYLAPEQVSGEPFDHRADLFSMATVLTEMAIGKPLFPGTGQLQVLLAIRDCRLGPLNEARGTLPAGLVPILEKALSRDPADRFQDAASFSRALDPFQGDVAAARRELAARVTSVQTISSETQLAAVRESARAMRAVRIDSSLTPVVAIEQLQESLDIDVDFFDSHDARDASSRVVEDEEADLREQDTGIYPLLESFVERTNGERLGPWTFAQLVLGISNGTVRRGDLIDYIGMGPRPVEQIPDLARLLPVGSAPPATPTLPAIRSTPAAPTGPTLGPPRVAAYVTELGETALLDVLALVLETTQSGQLVLERAGRDGDEPERREVFFLRGRLHHIASSNGSELLGESLVRRGKLSREELDLALAVLPRYGGRMGDTLIALGLVDGVDIFRAIREQGKDRMTDLFLWREGQASLFADAEIPAVDFPLDLDLPTLMLAGVEASHPGDAPMAFIEPRLDAIIVPNPRPELLAYAWPAIVAAVLEALATPLPLRALMTKVVHSGAASGADVARALELLLAMDLARWE